MTVKHDEKVTSLLVITALVTVTFQQLNIYIRIFIRVFLFAYLLGCYDLGFCLI
jgi:hypothetical protein